MKKRFALSLLFNFLSIKTEYFKQTSDICNLKPNQRAQEIDQRQIATHTARNRNPNHPDETDPGFLERPEGHMTHFENPDFDPNYYQDPVTSEDE